MIMSHTERVIILLDMDCFYCQVEEKLNPKLEGKPIAVVQYNAWRGGGIIAVNYPARDKGVTRHMRGQDAVKKCPDIILAKVPQVRGKADLTKYRDAGKRVADVLQTFTPLLERASVDEAYLDVTDTVVNKIKTGLDDVTIDKLKNTYVVGCETGDFFYNLSSGTEFAESNLKLCIGGIIAEKIRAEVLKQTGYKCSAGIAHNKILAKLACGLHKPNKQTILPPDAIPQYFKTVPVTKITGLGGKFGNELSDELGISNMGELIHFSEKQLVDKFGRKNGSWLYNLARGIEMEPVVTRLISKSIGCCKRFPGRTTLVTHDKIQHWMNELATEISERLEKDLEENNRKAKQMIVSFAQQINKKNVSSSRTHPLNSYEQTRIAQDSLEVIKKSCQKPDGSYNVTFLGISAGNFQDLKTTGVDIMSFFKKTTDLDVSTHIERKSKGEIEDMNNKIANEDLSEGFLARDDVDNSKDSDDDDFANHSIYSASTDDLEEDPKSYIYFEDIYPEFVSSQPLENYAKENKAQPSIPEEIQHKEELENRRKTSKSFFSKYFDSPREQGNPGQEEMNADEHIEKNCITNFRENGFIDNDNNSQMIVNTNNEGIEETQKENLQQSKTQSTKRKSSEVNISEYFENPEEPNEYYCPDCRKNIPLQDVFDHTDYHVAKKLQAELNRPPITNILNKAVVKIIPKKATMKATPKKSANGSIVKFFKPS